MRQFGSNYGDFSRAEGRGLGADVARCHALCRSFDLLVS